MQKRQPGAREPDQREPPSPGTERTVAYRAPSENRRIYCDTTTTTTTTPTTTTTTTALSSGSTRTCTYYMIARRARAGAHMQHSHEYRRTQHTHTQYAHYTHYTAHTHTHTTHVVRVAMRLHTLVFVHQRQRQPAVAEAQVKYYIPRSVNKSHV